MTDDTPSPAVLLQPEPTVDPAQIVRQANAQLVDLVANQGLYSSVQFEGPVGAAVKKLIDEGFSTEFDQWCVSCQRETRFALNATGIHEPGTVARYNMRRPINLFAYRATCTRQNHIKSYVMWINASNVTKIGQLPSVADVAQGELKSIDRALPKLDREELGRALGLFAHDIPLGAFVYLRRVFERMIARAHDRHAVKTGEPVPDFKKLSMEERIKAIADQLPEKVVQNRQVFKLLSLGIHELNDEQCKKLFPVTQAVVFQMLTDEERFRQAKEQDEATDAALQKALSAINEGTLGQHE